MTEVRIANRCPDCGNKTWVPVVDKPGDPWPAELKCGTPDCSFSVDYRVVLRLPLILYGRMRHPLLDKAGA